jgi:hypothetical protein
VLGGTPAVVARNYRLTPSRRQDFSPNWGAWHRIVDRKPAGPLAKSPRNKIGGMEPPRNRKGNREIEFQRAREARALRETLAGPWTKRPR